MTGTLKDLMTERADAEASPQVDVDAIVRAGDSRVRRRRVVAGAGAAAVAASVAFVVPAVVDSSSPPSPDRSRSVQPATAEFAQSRVSYAVGSSIHYGDRLIDVSPHDVATYVQTDDGFVFIDRQGTIYFADGADVVEIGRSQQPYGPLLAADDSGSYVGWVDTTPAVAEFVVYDTSSRSEVVRTSEGNQPTTKQTGEFDLPMIRSIDGQHAYWHSTAGITAWDLTAGTGELIAPDATYEWLKDVAAGQLARTSDNGDRIVVSGNPAGNAPAFDGWFADLSPNAMYLYTDKADEVRIFDVQTGDQVTPGHSGYPFIFLSQWLDDDSFVVVGIKAGNRETDPLDLLTCTISAGECTVAATEVGQVNELALPIGDVLD